MKTFLLALLCLVFGNVSFSFAQSNTLIGSTSPQPDTLNYNRPGLQIGEVIEYQKSRLLPSDTGEGSASHRLAVWERFWQERVYQNPAAGSGEPNMFDAYHNAARLAAVARQSSSCAAPSQWAGAWQSDGPDSSMEQKLGKVDHIWVSPTDTAKILIATTAGLFKSDSGGKNWHCLTDNVPITKSLVNINFIAVHPQNEDIIYLGTTSDRNRGIYYIAWAPDYGSGILASSDGGATWSQIIIPKDLTSTTPTYQDSIQSVNKVFFNPTGNKLYAFQNQRILYKDFPAGNWIDITPQNTPLPLRWNDLEFVPGVPDEFYITGDYAEAPNFKGVIWKYVYSSSSGHSTSSITVPMLHFAEEGKSSDSLSQIDLSIPNSSSIYLVGRSFQNQLWEGLFKIDRATQTWTTVSNDLPMEYWFHGAVDCFHLLVSPNNVNTIYYGSEGAFVSVDGGQIFNNISHYSGNPTHGDHRFIIAQHWSNLANSKGDRIYSANDGGYL